MYNIHQPERLGLEDALQRREVDDHELAQETARDGVVEHLVAEDLDLAREDRFAFGAARQRVEHIEENEAGEGHGGVAGGDFAVVAHFAVVCEERAEHDDGGGLQDALDKGARQDPCVTGTGGSRHDGWVDWFDTKGLGWRSVHEDVCETLEGHNDSDQGYALIQRICIALSGFWKPRKVLRRTKLRAAADVLSWKVMKF
jgi:hypothetical protein